MVVEKRFHQPVAVASFGMFAAITWTSAAFRIPVTGNLRGNVDLWDSECEHHIRRVFGGVMSAREVVIASRPMPNALRTVDILHGAGAPTERRTVPGELAGSPVTSLATSTTRRKPSGTFHSSLASCRYPKSGGPVAAIR